MVNAFPLLKAALLAVTMSVTLVLAAGEQAPEAKCIEHTAPRKLKGKPFSLSYNHEPSEEGNGGGSRKWEISKNFPAGAAHQLTYSYYRTWFYVDIDDEQTYTVNMMSDSKTQASRKFIVDVYSYRNIVFKKEARHPLRSFYISDDKICSFVGTVDNEASGPITVRVTQYE